MIPYETLLDAARQHFRRIASSPAYTRDARHQALNLERDATLELASLNNGRPKRSLRTLEPMGLADCPPLAKAA